MKRDGYLEWDAYFMGVAILSSYRSKDPGTQVGACIVSKNNRIMSVGYNGMPSGCSDDVYPWERDGDALNTKYLFVCHAELNAILNFRGGSLEGSRIYTTLFPCNECAKALIQSGISEIVYMQDKYSETDSVIASKKMMDSAGVKYRKYEPLGKEISLNL